MSSTAQPARSTATRWLILVRVASAAGAVMAGYLWWLRIIRADHPGCLASGDCSYVWLSAWATWFGLPVSALALLPYGLILFGTMLVTGEKQAETGRKLLACMAAFFLVIVCWFLLLQGVMIKQWCRLCLLSHGFSAATAGLIFLWLKVDAAPGSASGWFRGPAIAAGAALGLAAVAGHSVSSQQTTDALFRPLPGLTAFQRLDKTTIQLFGERVVLSRDALILSGSPEAPEVIITLFDYTCPDCRRLHSQMRHVTAAFPGRFYEIVLPAPLHSGCNPAVTQDSPLHASACELAKVAETVWRHKPSEFPAFHEWLMSGETPVSLETALERAQMILPAVDMRAELNDPANQKALALGVRTFQQNQRALGLDGLPLIMTERATLLGAPATIDRLIAHFR